ncbi:MAG TPA: hypothetical protein VK821_11205 [Dehalococcoidia bacterium]|nr:hypothetical protein [Dehalococcoidia bacterium]
MIDAIASPSERDHLRRIIGLPARRKLRFLFGLTRDDRLTPLMFAPLVGVIAYTLLPVNVIPRWLFLLRKFDNLIIGAVGLWLFVKLTPPEVLDEHLASLEAPSAGSS